MKNINKLGFWKKALIGLAVLSAGCSNFYAEPTIGFNKPVKEAGVKMNSAVTYGIKAGIKAKKIGVEASANFYQTGYETGMVTGSYDITDARLNAVIPFYQGENAEAYATVGASNHSENGSEDVLGTIIPVDITLSGFCAGIGARWKLSDKASLDARVEYGQYDTSKVGNREADINATIGAEFHF